MVATGIATIYERAPLIMAAAQRALGEQSGDRFLLGLGVSHAMFTQPLFGRAYDPPLRAMREYLDGMDAGPAMPGAPAGAPLSAGPRVLAALGPKMLALARDRALGAHPYFMPPEHTARARAILGPDRWLCPEVKVVLETDPARARALARAAGAVNITLPNYQRAWREFLGFDDADFANGGSDRLIDATIAWGDASAIRKHLDRHFAAGATQVCIHPSVPAASGPARTGRCWKRWRPAHEARVRVDRDRVGVLGRLSADRARREPPRAARRADPLDGEPHHDRGGDVVDGRLRLACAARPRSGSSSRAR